MKLTFILSLFFLLVFQKVDAQTLGSVSISGNITQNTTWSAKKVTINSNVVVQSGVVLTISSKTIVAFSGNYSLTVKGAIIAKGTAKDSLRFTVSDTTGYSTNTHTGWGGILFDNTSSDNTTSIFRYCIFEYAKKNGAIYSDGFSNFSISNCLFRANYSTKGAALHLENSSPSVVYSCFYRNKSDTAIVYLFNGNSVFSCNRLLNNNGSAILIENSVPSFTNNILANNWAKNGAGLYLKKCTDLKILNNVFVNNQAENGSAIYLSDSYSTCVNLIIWGNSPSSSQVFWGDKTSKSNFKYCNLENGKSAFSFVKGASFSGDYANNHIFNPLFLSPTTAIGTIADAFYADFSLQKFSQNINAGDVKIYPVNYPKDIAGNTRIYSNTSIDIGAYEHSFTVAPIDSITLIDFYKDTNGINWKTTWDTTLTVSNYLGITTVGGRVTKINLPNNNLIGTIPASLQNLLFLEQLQLYGNQFDTLTSQLGNLPNLTLLNLQETHLKGTIPTALLKSGSLETINLSNNYLEGKIPNAFKKQSNLLLLELSNNNFTDMPDFSSTDTQLSSLQVLSVFGNKLTFKELKPNINVFSGFQYSPQQAVDVVLTYNITELDSAIFTVNISGKNTYQWYFNGVFLKESTKCKINKVHLDDAGTYTCKITNSDVPNLTLERNPIYLVVIPDVEKDRQALMDLYKATNGDHWIYTTNWNTDQPLENWYGILMKNGRVVELDLSNNKLTGSLPTTIVNINHLTELKLNDNQITGIIPENIGDLKKLTDLTLNDNSFSGAIPTSIANLAKLAMLNLSQNQLSGAVPTEIGSLAELAFLDLSSNLFTSLPDFSKDSLNNLQQLSVDDNYFTFKDLIPNYGIFSGYQYSPQKYINETLQLYIVENDLVTMQVNVEGNQNYYQWLKDNNSINDATSSVYTFTASANSSGVYTCWVTNAELPNLILIRNPIIQTIYPNIQKDSLALLAVLQDLKGTWKDTCNWLKQPIQQWYGVKIGEISKRVEEVNLSGKNLSGTLNGAIGNLDYLQKLNINNNSITGTIPESIGNLSRLTTLNLSNNLFFGTIPKELGSLSKLIVLYLNNNQLIGDVPIELENLTDLSFFALNNNLLTALPVLSSSKLYNLQVLILAYNRFTFDDLKDNKSQFPSVFYMPQLQIGEKQSFTVKENDALILSVNISEENNLYRWKKDGQYITDLLSSPTYAITSAKIGDEGSYVCEVSNSYVPLLLLESYPILLTVELILEAPVVKQLKPYCVGDETVTVFTENPDDAYVYWYHDNALKDSLSNGYKIRYSVKNDRDTLYAVRRNYRFFSDVVPVPIVVRPSLSFESNTLKATFEQGASYQWYYNGKLINLLTDNTLHYQGDGEYIVKLITQNQECVSFSKPIILKNQQLLSSSTSLETIAINVFPNPTQDMLNLQFQNVNQTFEVRLFDVTGRLIKQIHNSYLVDIQEFKSGLYLLEIQTENSVFRKQIVKK